MTKIFSHAFTQTRCFRKEITGITCMQSIAAYILKTKIIMFLMEKKSKSPNKTLLCYFLLTKKQEQVFI